MIIVRVEQRTEGMETVGERVRRLRLERGLSQRAVASPGVSYAYISRIEAGRRQPSMKALRKLAAMLGVTPEYLETGTDLTESDRREFQIAEAELALRFGDADRAERQLERLAEQARAAGDLMAAARARLALALAVDARGEHAAAVAAFEEAFALERPSPLVRIDVYATLGAAYSALGRSEDEIALYHRCLDELEKLPDGTTAQTRYRILLSYALSDAGSLDEAERVLQAALEETARDEDPYMRVRVYWSMARLAEMEGRSPAALRYARRALTLLEATEDHLHRARAHLLAAWIMNSIGNGAGAEEQLDLAETLFRDSATADDVARMKVERSRCATLAGDGAGAANIAREAIDALGDAHAPILGTAYAALGNGLALQHRIEEAEAAFRRGVDLLEETHRWREAYQACRAWANLVRDAGRQQEALDLLDRAAELALHAPPRHAASPQMK